MGASEAGCQNIHFFVYQVFSLADCSRLAVVSLGSVGCSVPSAAHGSLGRGIVFEIPFCDRTLKALGKVLEVS